jgi:anaerobic ribonucleoside-triphosphate reductase
MSKDNVEFTKRQLGEGIKFERIRRITGYLTGTLDRWNDGKQAEEHDRVKHSA